MRLTHLCKYADKRKNKEPMIKIRNKLFELENIEEELGVDLITLFKALNGFWYKINQLVKETEIWQIEYNLKLKLFRVFNDTFYFKDYGKTWALTKEELK